MNLINDVVIEMLVIFLIHTVLTIDRHIVITQKSQKCFGNYNISDISFNSHNY